MKNNFYLSRILGNKIYTPDMKVIGRLSDLGVVNELKSPHVTTAKVKINSGIKDYDFKNFSITKQKGQYILICNKIEEYTPPNTLFLRKHILDQQIIDVNGRKVVRVNDVSLSYLEKGAYVVAVDIGIDGLLRRIGIAKPLKMLGLKVSTKLMLWNDVEAIITSNENIVLSKTYDSLSILHPSDLADIIEDFDTKAVGSLMSTDFVYFNNNETINQAIEDLRVLKPEEDELFSLYVVDENDKLIGTLSLRDLIISAPTSKISAIMNKKFKSMFDTDSIKDLMKNVSKYNLVAIPVTNHEMKLLGNVIINDIIYELLKNKRKVS
ncbi:CBS domain-containing protein [Clostridium tagluense]|uniref:CBS domain-containing protein n=1 Tax=Clostridium tagluense TaxID=360422 RepID=UPI001CF1498D|nr:CBS domain-containing protein [Clostridium tagluense]MCB2298447.1 CBS domain-containing protein [Clostridium tagluense]